MKQNNISFFLSMIAGLVCFGIFIYKYLKTNETDSMLLVAGIFIVAFGIGMRFMRRRN